MKNRVRSGSFVALVSAGLVLLGACTTEPGEADLSKGDGVTGDAGIGQDARSRADGGSSDDGPEACPQGTWDHDGNPVTACIAWSTCAAGTYVTNTPSATSDRTCAGCASGSFSTTANAASCKAWSSCSAGTYVSTPGSVASDRQCTACAAGTYSSSANQSSCVPAGACAAGTEQTAAPTPTSPAVCTACEVGTYCAGAATTKQACASGTWDHDSNPATACVPWTACASGQSVGAAGSATTDRTCTACPSASYSTTSNALTCLPWNSCAAGTYVSTPGSAVANRECTACAEGTYTSSPNQTTCQPIGTCAAGTEQTAPATPASPAVCTPCETGTYCAGGTTPKAACANETWDHDGNAATACVAWTECAPGQSVGAAGSTTTDRTCRGCTSGSFSTTSNAASCTPWSDCAPGSYVTTLGSAVANRQCATCAAETYTSLPNESLCLPAGTCAAGTEQTAASTPTSPVVCAACEAGTYCAGGTTPKQVCSSGSWDHDGTSATVCVAWTSCTPGEAVTICGGTTTDRTCAACANGTFSTTANATSCAAWSTCAPGTIVSAAGTAGADRQCAACPAGETSMTANAAACVPLPSPGSSCATAGQIFGRACGNCGTQTASCSPTNVVTDFSTCVEPAGACQPGSTEAATACGYCGTTSRICNAQCAWTAQACEGEVASADRCLAGEKQNRTEGCQDGITRSWTCDASCAWASPAMTCEEASRIFTIGSTVGATVVRPLTQLGDKIKRLTASSSPCNVSTMTDSHYVYIEVRNPNATAAKVELGVATAAGQPAPNVLIAAYTTLPSDATARKACLTGAELGCNNNAAFKACLIGNKAPTIPANGSIWVYVGNFSGPDTPLTFNFSASVASL